MLHEKVGLSDDSGVIIGTTKFDYPNLQLPGGENYRELVLTLPEKTPTPENITPLNVSESANFIESKLDPADTFTPDRFWYFLGPKEEIIPQPSLKKD